MAALDNDMHRDRVADGVFEKAASRALADHVRDIVLLIDTSGSIVMANLAAERTYGYSRDELAGMRVQDLRAPETSRLVASQMEQARSAGVLFETVHKDREGREFPVEVSSQGVEILGEPYLLSVVRDISVRKRREQEREDLLRDVESANRQLEGLLRIVSSTVGRLDSDALFDEVLSVLRDVMGAESALLFVREPEVWRLRAQTGYAKMQPGEFTMPLDSGFASEVAEAGEITWLPDVTAIPTTIPAHTTLGVKAMIGVPLHMDGELFGVLECTWHDERLFSDSERVMLQVAADRIVSAIAGASRFEETVRERRLDAALAEISERLNVSHDLEEMLPGALEIASDALACDAAAFGAFSQGTYSPQYVYRLPDHPVALGGHPAYSDSAGGTIAFTRGEGHGPADDLLGAFGLDEGVVAPVAVRGAWFGALFFGRKTAAGFDEPAHAFLRKLASLVSLAYANADDFQAEHRIAETLQEAILRLDADVPGVDVGHLYRSATLATRVGGDFYDVFPMHDGRIGLLVGDVSGKGLDAAVLTAFIKNTVRAFAHAGSSPAEILSNANEVLTAAARLPEFASVLLLVYDPAGGEVVYCCGGHPPALIRRAEGSVERLECDSPVLGAFPGLDFCDRSFVLSPGDLVVLYTDGVTEARALDGTFFGDERLMEAVLATVHFDVNGLPAALNEAVMRFTGGRLTDDIAILTFSPA